MTEDFHEAVSKAFLSLAPRCPSERKRKDRGESDKSDSGPERPPYGVVCTRTSPPSPVT
jgi:hypothetical protein